MRVDRDRYSRHFSCLAALVLLAQLLLAAAHVHLIAPHGVPVTASSSHDTNRVPAGPVHQGDPSCPLCWVQTAAGGLLVPAAIELRIPADFAVIRLSPVFPSLTERTAPNAFHPRAPPHARLRLTA